MSPTLRVRDTETRELMDDPHADARMLARTYGRFGLVNALVSRPGTLYRRDIRPRARRSRPLRILDVGAGGGDLCRLLAGRLRRDGLPAEITARGSAIAMRSRATWWRRATPTTSCCPTMCCIISTTPSSRRCSPTPCGSRLPEAWWCIATSPAAAPLRCCSPRPPGPSRARSSPTRSSARTASSASAAPTRSTSSRRSPPPWQVRAGVPSRLELRWEDDRARP